MFTPEFNSDDDETVDTPLIRIDLEGVTDKAGFLAAVAAALHFPAHFGHNWDALADCLTDLSWLPRAPGYAIAFDHADAFAAAAPEAFATALSIFQEAADFWRAEGVALWTLVGSTQTVTPDFQDPT